jgi:hypothetical protein
MCVDVPSPDHKSRLRSISLAMAGNRRSLSLSPSLSSQPRAPSPAAPLSVFSSCSSSPSPVQQRVRDSGFHLLCGLHSPAASVANRRLIGAPSVPLSLICSIPHATQQFPLLNPLRQYILDHAVVACYNAENSRI